jgi:hypothetical protein
MINENQRSLVFTDANWQIRFMEKKSHRLRNDVFK